MFDLVPFITLSMFGRREKENVVSNSKREYYGDGATLVPIKVLPWEEFIEND